MIAPTRILEAPRQPSDRLWWQNPEYCALQRRFEKLLTGFVGLLDFAEASTSVVDDQGNLIVSPRVKSAHETLQSVTRIL
jgi:hypothetical protein